MSVEAIKSGNSFKGANSDPTKKDSDRDGINDYFTNYDYDVIVMRLQLRTIEKAKISCQQ